MNGLPWPGKREHVKGLELSKKYYHECIKPIIRKSIPEISNKYAAELIGFGSDVLGNDDDFSREHEWGPRCYLSKIAPQIEGELLRVLESKDYYEKSDAMNFIYEIILSHMKSYVLCDSYPKQVRPNVSGVRFDIQRSAKDVLEKVSGELASKTISGIPIGAVDQWMTNEDIIMNADYMNSFSPVYNPKRTERNRLGDLFMVSPL